jgi:hypothetical protein
MTAEKAVIEERLNQLKLPAERERRREWERRLENAKAFKCE